MVLSSHSESNPGVPCTETQALTCYSTIPSSRSVSAKIVLKLNWNPLGHVIQLSAFTFIIYIFQCHLLFFYKFNGCIVFHYMDMFYLFLSGSISEQEIKKLVVKYPNNT
jgi:hypothetical protein